MRQVEGQSSLKDKEQSHLVNLKTVLHCLLLKWVEGHLGSLKDKRQYTSESITLGVSIPSLPPVESFDIEAGRVSRSTEVGEGSRSTEAGEGSRSTEAGEGSRSTEAGERSPSLPAVEVGGRSIAGEGSRTRDSGSH